MLPSSELALFPGRQKFSPSNSRVWSLGLGSGSSEVGFCEVRRELHSAPFAEDTCLSSGGIVVVGTLSRVWVLSSIPLINTSVHVCPRLSCGALTALPPRVNQKRRMVTPPTVSLFLRVAVAAPGPFCFSVSLKTVFLHP